MSKTTTLSSSEAGIAAPNIGAETAEAKTLRIPMRPLKIGIGISLLMAGAYGIFSERQFLSTDNAVVSAYLTEVRTPIDGVLTGMPAAAGGRFAQGAVLGSVDNELFDEQHLQNLSILEQQAQSGADALRAERMVLEGEKRDLLQRASVDMDAVAARLRGQEAEAERLLAARVAELDETRRELARGAQLHDLGILSGADFEKLQSQNTVAVANEAAQRADVATIQAEVRAAMSGTLSEPGMNSDVPYSRQRADEVNMRLAQIAQTQVALDAQAKEANLNIAAENERMMQMRHSELKSPIPGMLWKLEAVNGERVETGNPVAQLVDCDHSFVLAEVPQRRVPELVIGAQARLRLSGESQDRFGRVTEVSGDPQSGEHRKFAAFPPEDPHENLATVRISLDGSGSEGCWVGRSARVAIAINDVNPIVQFWRHYQ